MNFKEEAYKVQDEIVAFRRDLHMHPEASMQEVRTTGKIIEKLEEYGIPYKKLDPTGVIAEIKGAYPGKTIALRADIDALSIQENTGLEFSSVNDGFMHACGHDTHPSMLMGAAKILNSVKDQLHGTVRLFFQPGEEVCEGARAVCAQGGMDGVDTAFGIHIGSMKECGSITLTKGASHASTDQFFIRVSGKTSHGARPEAGHDAVVAAAAITMALQTMVSRESAPTKPLVVTVGKLWAGSRFNIISGSALLEGTCRSYDVELHKSLPSMMERIAKNVAEAYGCTAEVEYKVLTEVCVNDEARVDSVWKSALKVADRPELVLAGTAQMGGEDFAEYTTYAPCAFASLGAGGEHPQHSEKVVFDEASFPTGVALYCQVAWDFLNGEE